MLFCDALYLSCSLSLLKLEVPCTIHVDSQLLSCPNPSSLPRAPIIMPLGTNPNRGMFFHQLLFMHRRVLALFGHSCIARGSLNFRASCAYSRRACRERHVLRTMTVSLSIMSIVTYRSECLPLGNWIENAFLDLRSVLSLDVLLKRAGLAPMISTTTGDVHA